MKKIFYMLTGAVLTLLVLGVAGYGFAQSQNPPSPQPPAVDGFPMPGSGMMRDGLRNGMRPGLAARAGMMGWKHGFTRGYESGAARGYAGGMLSPLHDFMITALAEKLGLSVETLQEKVNNGERPFEIAKAQGMTDEQIKTLLEEAHDQALAAAVAAGVLTQAQAEAMQSRMEMNWQNGAMPGRAAGRQMHVGIQGPLHEYRVAALAEALGLTSDQVIARLENGERAQQIAESLGLSAEEFQAKLLTASQAAINQALVDGKITQAQADWMLQNLERLSESGFGPAGFGGGRFKPGGCPGMNGNLPAQP